MFRVKTPTQDNSPLQEAENLEDVGQVRLPEIAKSLSQFPWKILLLMCTQLPTSTDKHTILEVASSK